jgi:shikimate kinase/3-dehydroquinate synthase
VFVTGLPGAGKTVVGKAVAGLANVPFVDLTEAIERQAGCTAAEIVAQKGKEAFASLEKSALAEQLEDPTPRVVALGAATLLNRPTRLAVLDRGAVVSLTAAVEELARRVPGCDAERLAEQAVARAAGYAEAHAVVDTTSRSIDDVAAEVFGIGEESPIAVPLGERTYVVDVGAEQAEVNLSKALARLAPSRVVFVTDEVVWPLWGERLDRVVERVAGEPVRVILPPGERNKTLAAVERILKAAVEAPVDRGAVVVGVGGGVVTDVAGLCAAVALRGLRWIAVPTTLLSMVDASVGGKTAVDLGSAKNAVGVFHQPSRVIVDPLFTCTESPRAVSSGLAEVLKTALIGDPILYQEMLAEGGAERLAAQREIGALTRAIRSSVTVKAGVVSRDEREAGERAHLNLGHTIGHALEAEGGFSRLSHGEGVALGLVAALRIGEALGVTPADVAAQIISVLRRLHLPTDLDQQPVAEALRWVSFDKKRRKDAVRMVLVRAPGAVEVVSVVPAELPRLLRPSA